ncbi:MAG: DUF1559 domain-containing protein [Planctomycetaceae bacterium]|jgi:prepilin-type N-terminal cleavage/methylation domain-containing protein|nr:DUF1559 domain-containing protein [Planctomycetaceae bacterium]
MSKRFVKNAFTLLELLVVVAIIGVLIALLLPAVQAAREAARRFQCTNNLMQLGVAVKHYESNRGVLPSGTVNETGPIRNVPIGDHLGWIPRILPYIEQTPLYEKIDFSKGCYSLENRKAWFASTFSGLNCPSDGYRYSYSKYFSCDESDQLSQPNYMVCQGGAETPINTDNNGVFFLNSKIRSRDIFDGTSNTVFLGESIIFDKPEESTRRYSPLIKYILPEEKETLNSGDETAKSEETEQNEAAPEDDEDADSYEYSYGGLGWMSGTPGTIRNTGNPVNTLVGPFCNWEMYREETPWNEESMDSGLNEKTDESEEDRVVKITIDPKFYEQELPGQFLVGGYSSYHVGGANHLMGDGSIRFVTPETELSVYQKLGNRNDNQSNKIP